MIKLDSVNSKKIVSELVSQFGVEDGELNRAERKILSSIISLLKDFTTDAVEIEEENELSVEKELEETDVDWDGDETDMDKSDPYDGCALNEPLVR